MVPVMIFDRIWLGNMVLFMVFDRMTLNNGTRHGIWEAELGQWYLSWYLTGWPGTVVPVMVFDRMTSDNGTCHGIWPDVLTGIGSRWKEIPGVTVVHTSCHKQLEQFNNETWNVRVYSYPRSAKFGQEVSWYNSPKEGKMVVHRPGWLATAA